MQLQAPREVLAEAAMDALFLSYADPELAAEVILGHFESTLHPNLPCMREDGSYNMVADDGQICGTAPEWAFLCGVAINSSSEREMCTGCVASIPKRLPIYPGG